MQNNMLPSCCLRSSFLLVMMRELFTKNTPSLTTGGVPRSEPASSNPDHLKGRLPLRGEVKPVRVHHLGPGRDEVLDELLVVVVLGVDFGIGAQDGV